jgi:hypothetical protein
MFRKFKNSTVTFRVASCPVLYTLSLGHRLTSMPLPSHEDLNCSVDSAFALQNAPDLPPLTTTFAADGSPAVKQSQQRKRAFTTPWNHPGTSFRCLGPSDFQQSSQNMPDLPLSNILEHRNFNNVGFGSGSFHVRERTDLGRRNSYANEY